MQVDDYDVPPDWSDPDWDKEDRIHNWRNYIIEPLQKLWQTFTDEQKQAIAANAEDRASREEWD